jgi:hypothetical protein
VKSLQGRPNGMYFPTPNGPKTNPWCYKYSIILWPALTTPTTT